MNISTSFALTGAALIVAISIGVVVFIIMLIAYTNVISRAGYSRWWSLVMIVPLLNIIMLLIFCFKEWPAQRELRELRDFKARSTNAYGYPGQPGFPPPPNYGGQYGGSQYPGQ